MHGYLEWYHILGIVLLTITTVLCTVLGTLWILLNFLRLIAEGPLKELADEIKRDDDGYEGWMKP